MNYRFYVWRDKFLLWLAKRLPVSLKKWVLIDCLAHATQGKWGAECPDSVSVFTAWDRLDE